MSDQTLEQINGKLTVTNQWLDTIYSQNAEMILNQEQLISGDIAIINNQNSIITLDFAILSLLAILLFFIFFIRSLL